MAEIQTIEKPRLQQFLERVFFCVLLVFVCTQFAYAGKIVKWTDENGVVHYGDSVPPKAAGKGNTVLNNEGVVVKKNDAYKTQESKLDTAYSEQLRKDKALLASYSSIEEIDLALKRHLSTEQNLLTVLMRRLGETKSSLNKKLALRDKQLRAGKQPAKYLEKDIAANLKQVERTQAEVTATKNHIALTQNRFATYRARYAELRPRDQSLKAINRNERNLDDLIAWKRQANRKLSSLLKMTVEHKRAGEAVPEHIAKAIQKANTEIARADQEIAAIQRDIKDSQQTFTSK